MSEPRDVLARSLGALIALALQIVVAPNLAAFGIVPNFLLAYVLALAVSRSEPDGPVLAFLCGLAYDLVGNGPVGAMALLLMLASLASSRAFFLLNNDTAFIPLLVLVVASLAVNVAYAVVMLMFGVDVGLLQAFVYRALPCTLFDCVLGLIAYPLAVRFLAHRSQPLPGQPKLR